MGWFINSLIVIAAWGSADLFYKKGSDRKDRYSAIKIVIAVGFVMGIHAIIYMLINQIDFSPMLMLKYLPVSLMYAGSMAIGYVGLRYIELSVCSPIQNSSGAVASILCFIFLKIKPLPIVILGIALISVGIFLLSLFEKKEEDKLRTASGEAVDKKYVTGALAIIFPILYCIIDGLGTFADAIYLNEDKPIMSEDEALLAYEFTFLLIAAICFIYLRFIKKERFNVIKEHDKFFAAGFETLGQYFYVFAMADESSVAAAMVSAYCVFSVILSRLFLKEKLTFKQYIAIITVTAGIILLGIFSDV
ncbi:MAG: DMT family transporter [Clostridiales bacterium]|nr:DMT family transporter [Clostridiales bacterium]